MTPSKILAFLATVADFVFGGLLSNAFITAVIITEWAKSRSLAACEQLLLSLGISNISVTVLLILYLFAFDVTFLSRESLIAQLYICFTIYVMFIRFWLAAWLCVFYCIKILNSTHSFILWWKMRISRLVPRLIVGSCVVSFLASVIMVLSDPKPFQSNGAANITNITQTGKMEELWSVSRNLFLVIGSGCPLIIVFLCSIVIVGSLFQHICQMTSKGSNIRNLQTEAHVRAAGTVLSLLVLYISFYVAQTMGLILEFQKKQIAVLMCSIVLLMYSPIQAAILVLSNPKLKQAVSQMLARTTA